MPKESAEPKSQEEKRREMFQAFKDKGLAGIKEVLHQRNEEYLNQMEAEYNRVVNLPPPPNQ